MDGDMGPFPLIDTTSCAYQYGLVESPLSAIGYTFC